MRISICRQPLTFKRSRAACIFAGCIVCIALLIRDILIDDALNRAVLDQGFKLRVEGIVDGAVLGEADRVFFVGIGGIEQLQAFVARDECGSNLAIDDHAVNLAGLKGKDGIGRLIVAVNGVAQAVGFNIIGDVQIAGRALLHADGKAVIFIEEIVYRCDRAAFGDDDRLNRRGVGRGEIYILLALLGDGEAGHAEIHLAAHDRHDDGIELHIFDFQFIAQRIAYGLRNFNIDAYDFAGFIVIVLIGRKIDAGAHRQRLG